MFLRRSGWHWFLSTVQNVITSVAGKLQGTISLITLLVSIIVFLIHLCFVQVTVPYHPVLRFGQFIIIRRLVKKFIFN